ncbi:MAG: pilus assembly FimT family protein [Planctomycetota bacterium]
MPIRRSGIRQSRRVRAGISLLEVLIVLAIIALFASLSYQAVQPAQDWLVETAAMRLEAKMAQARSLARRTERNFGIVFHIGNAGDRRVMRNFTADDPPDFAGRHWYALIGPNAAATMTSYQWNHEPDKPPLPLAYASRNPTVAEGEEFQRDTIRSFIGGRVHLPRGVRFLALTDFDGGSLLTRDHYSFRRRSDWLREAIYTAGMRFSEESVRTVFPRPWFGVLAPGSLMRNWMTLPDESLQVLMPWGGYDPELDALLGHISNMGEGLTAFATKHADDGVLIHGERQEIGIYFAPDGRALQGQTLSGRNLYPQWQHIRCIDFGDQSFSAYAKGLYHPYHWGLPQGSQFSKDNMIAPFGPQWDPVTGGFHITLARDVDEEEISQVDQQPLYPVSGRYDLFRSKRDALQSLRPLARVFVDRASGASEVRLEDHPLCQIRPDQRRVSAAEVLDSEVPASQARQWYLPRPAHRHTYSADALATGLRDADWVDGPDGWRGWHPTH